jgi:outer membrane lipoprotein-sorting protein
VYSEESILNICVLILLVKSKLIVYYIFNKLLSALSKAYANSESYAYDFWYKVSKTGEERFMLELKCAHCRYMWTMPIRN